MLLLMVKNGLTLKSRIYGVERAKGTSPAVAAKAASYATPDRAAFVAEEKGNLTPHKKWKQENKVRDIINFWEHWLSHGMKIDPAEAKLSDVIKVSELLAKHHDMFKPEDKGNTFNTIVMGDGKELNEQQVMSALARIRALQAGNGEQEDIED